MITHENYRYFINYDEGKLKNTVKFTHEVFSKDVTLDNPKNEVQKQKILLKDLMKENRYGVYKVTVEYEDKDHNGKKINRSASKVIFVSDIGMSVNLSEDQAFISLLKLSDGTPLPDATVDLYSVNNILIATAVSDKDGIAVIEKTALMGKEPKAVIVSAKEDKSFLLLKKPVNDVTYRSLKKAKERYLAHIYFQSNIIRPAGTIHALITVKDRNFISAGKIPLKVVLSEVQGKKLHEKVYTTDKFGLIDFSYTMVNYDKTGAYRLKVMLGDKVIGKKIIDVEAFMPPKIENRIKTDKTIYSSDAFIKAKISSAYLFGAPGSYLSGKVNYTATAFDYVDPKYKGYSFTNHTLDGDNELLYINMEQDITLDSKGEIEIILPCRTSQQVPSVLKAMIGATIMDDTQPVSAYKEVYIYPYKALVGVKLAQESIESGKMLTGKTVLIDPLKGNVIERELTVMIKKINWHYNYSNGHYNWEKEMHVIDTFVVSSNQAFSREIQENGDFVIEVIDRLQGHSASSSFEVSGWGYTNISPKEDLKSVEIRFEERLYRKGDRLKVSLKSPVLEGRVLLTLEGDRVYWHKSFTIDKGVAEVEVPLEHDLKQGVYLHATAVRKTDTRSNIIPFRAMGYKFIKPDRTAHKIRMTLEYPQTTSSKKTVSLRIETDRESAVLVSVVDTGILNITEQKPPKIFDFFNPVPDKKLLYFDLYDKVMHYLTEGNVIAFGAGDMEALEKRKKHLAPENLERVKPFMLWSKIIHTTDKEATVDLPIPEFNGKATIVAVAVDEHAVGVASGELIIKDDIMIKPSYPRFLLKGDRIEVPVRIFNTTAQEQRVILESNSTSNIRLTVTDAALQIAPNSSKVLIAELTALKEGKSRIELAVQAGGERFSRSVELQVMSPYAIRTKGYMDAVSRKRTITVPKAYRGGKVLISLSDNLLGQLRGDLKYLVSYPYGCVEQTSSKIAALFYAKPFMKHDSLLGESDNFIRQGIKKLSRMLNGYGEFSYWEQGGYVNQYASLYTAQILLELDTAGYRLDGSVKKRVISALKQIAKGNQLSVKYDNHHRIYAAYILSEHQALEASTANMLYDKGLYKKYYFSWFYMAAIFKNMHQDQLAEQLYAGVSQIRVREIEKLDYHAMDLRSFASKSRDIFLLLYLNAKYFRVDKDDLDRVKKRLSKLYSTHEKAMAFKAMSTYLGKAVHDKMVFELILNGETGKYQNPVAFTKELKGESIVINPLSGVVNYSIEFYKHLPRVVKNVLSTKKDLSIRREFIDMNGKSVDLKNLEQGSKIYSKITVANYSKIENMVLNQRIPACMDIINTRITKSANTPFKDKNLLLDYKDIRDDRVLYFLHLDQKTKYEPVPGTNKRKRIVLQNRTVLYTPLIVTTVGECHLPAVTIEAMYDSRVNDYAKEIDTIIVRAKGKSQKARSSKQALSIEEKVKNRVKEFYMLEAAGSKPNDFIPYFSYPVKQYFNKKNVSKAYILNNKKRYNTEWPQKKYRINSIEITGEDKQSQTYSVKIIFEYHLKNSRGKSIKGISKHLLSIKHDNGKLLIEKITTMK
jgi:uncharacterized protein YfaS (alpha-2-macroglobulin family)